MGRLHAPDEFFRIRGLRVGIRAWDELRRLLVPHTSRHLCHGLHSISAIVQRIASESVAPVASPLPVTSQNCVSEVEALLGAGNVCNRPVAPPKAQSALTKGRSARHDGVDKHTYAGAYSALCGIPRRMPDRQWLPTVATGGNWRAYGGRLSGALALAGTSPDSKQCRVRPRPGPESRS